MLGHNRLTDSPSSVHQSNFHMNESMKLTEESDTAKIEECNITLYTKETATEAQIIMTECFGSPIIETACTSTLCKKDAALSPQWRLANSPPEFVPTEPSSTGVKSHRCVTYTASQCCGSKRGVTVHAMMMTPVCFPSVCLLM